MMRIYENGMIRDMTPEELAAAEKAQATADLREKTRPMSAAEVTSLLITAQINAISVDDNTALRMLEFYPQWASGTEYSAGFKAQRNGRLWRCIQAHTAQDGWEPENAASLWEQINETHAGTQEDPIPYDGNMALESGKYYHQDGVVYLCIRDSGSPVYNSLADLAGLYVEEV